MSDNASYFILARKFFLEHFRYITEIEWHTITPHASHEGGVYERLNKNVKDSIKRTIRRKQISSEEFETMLISIEGSINNRPLLTMVDDPNNHQILRPVDFIRPITNDYQEIDKNANKDELEDTNFILNKTTVDHLRQLHNKYIQKLNEFWKLWTSNYLIMLRDHKQQNSSSSRKPRIGELVLIEAPEKRRSEWKLGRISKLITNRDDVIRTCELILPNRKRTKRAIYQLFPLEVGGDIDEDELKFQNLEEERKTVDQQPTQRKLRNTLHPQLAAGDCGVYSHEN